MKNDKTFPYESKDLLRARAVLTKQKTNPLVHFDLVFVFFIRRTEKEDAVAMCSHLYCESYSLIALNFHSLFAIRIEKMCANETNTRIGRCATVKLLF